MPGIVVVGAGIAGSALTRLARHAGHHVTLIAAASPPHSLAATAVLRRAYHAKSRAEQDDWTASLAQYGEWGIPLTRGGRVTGYRKPEPHPDPDWSFIDPAAPLVDPDVVAEVTTVTGTTARTATGDTYRGDHIVTATGAASRFTPDGLTTWGVTWVHPDPAALTHRGQVTVHHFAPYKTITAGVAGGQARLGSSTGRSLTTAREQARKMLDLAAAHHLITTREGWVPVTGARVQTSQTIQRQPGGAWWLGGFHRTGYALAPAAARRLLAQLEGRP